MQRCRAALRTPDRPAARRVWRDLLGVLATGSRIHGTPGPTSDLDVHVVIDQPRRQRRNIILDGLEIEMFINPAVSDPTAIWPTAETISICSPSAARSTIPGFIVQLQNRARALWQAGPPALAESARWMPRYAAADMLRDLIDLGEDRPRGLQIARSSIS